MIGSGLKKFAQDRGLSVGNNVGYGSLGGFAATLSEGSGFKRIVFSTKFSDQEKKMAFMQAVELVNVKKEYRVQKLDITQDRIVVNFQDSVGTMKKIEAFTDWFVGLLQNHGAATYDICPRCGGQITAGKWVMINDYCCYMHDSCAQAYKQEIARSNEARKQEDNGSYVSGFFGAAIGALLGAIVWAVVLMLGYVASIVAFVIGWLAEKGYNMMHGKQDKMKIVILAVVILAAVFVGTLGGYFLSFIQEGYDFEFVASIFFDTVFGDGGMEYFAKDFFMGLLFAALGVVGMLAQFGKELKGDSITELK